MSGGTTRSVGVSLVIPVYNETDGSDAVLRGLRAVDPRVRVLTFAGNAGQSAAMDAGFKSARGDVVVTLDADLQNDPADIPRLLEALKGTDAAVGVRRKREDNLVRRVSSKVANYVRNQLSDETIADTGCSLKAFRRAALQRLVLYNGMHRFLPTLLKMEGFRVQEVPVGHRPRRHGESKYGIGNRLLPSFMDLLAVRWMKRRKLRYEVKDDI